jgi:hypothetical protein
MTDMIKKVICILFFYLAFTSCRHEPTITKASFDYIDVSFNNGPSGIISVFIDSSGLIKVRKIERDKKSHYYQDSLQDKDLLKLSSYAKKVFFLKIDTLVGSPGCFSFPYYLIIANKKKVVRTLVFQDRDYAYKQLDSLVKQVDLLAKTIKQKPLDTNFIFASLEKVLGPKLVTGEMVKFVPPIIKEIED